MSRTNLNSELREAVVLLVKALVGELSISKTEAQKVLERTLMSNITIADIKDQASHVYENRWHEEEESNEE